MKGVREANFWKVVHVYGLSLPPDEEMIASKACGKKHLKLN